MGLARALIALILLGVPLLVIAMAPQVFELAGAVPLLAPTPVAFATPFRLPDPTPPSKTRFAGLDEAPPPTLAPAATATPAPRPTPTGERAIVANTGGIGAVLRAEPVSGQPVASLREQVEVIVLERRRVSGVEWARVRTLDDKEGWVLGLVARPIQAGRP